jgi:PPOX class probable F420-dependent enzyme
MSTIPESHQDLLQSQFASLGTIDDAGFPQITEVWFLYDESDGKVRFSLNETRHKVKYLQKRPQCSVFLLDLPSAGRWLEIRGHAEISPDDDYEFADRVGAKYGGVDLRQMDQPGQKRVVVSVEPVKVNSWALP